VCQVCGSTLTEIPASCPICGEAGSHYVEVPGFPGPRQPESEDEEDY
jgi:predicted amidophosphoribosyltransferase